MLVKITLLKSNLDLLAPLLNLLQTLDLFFFYHFTLFQPQLRLRLQILQRPLVEQLVVQDLECYVVLVLLHLAGRIIKDAPDSVLIALGLCIRGSNLFAMLLDVLL